MVREAFEFGIADSHRRYFDEHLIVTRRRLIKIKHPHFKICGADKGSQASNFAVG